MTARVEGSERVAGEDRRPMLLVELVEASQAVAGTSARRQKVGTLAGLLARLHPAEVRAAVGLLAAEPRQGRLGVGWATLAGLAIPPAGRPWLTVSELDRALTRIQQTTGSGSAAKRARILAELLARLTEAEQGFVRRRLLGELRQGALEGVMTEAVARAAGVPTGSVRRALMLSGDLGRTAEIALGEGEAGLRAVGLEILRPIQPMLASSAQDLETALAQAGPASVEWKLDGVRIQVHRRGEEVRLFTRNLNEVTERLPEVTERARRLPASQVVLDGEVILEGDDGRPHPFQETMARVASQEADPSLRVVPYFFDCLHLDGQDLVDQPLQARLAALERVVGAARVPSITGAEAGQARRFLAEALARGHRISAGKPLPSGTGVNGGLHLDC